MRRKLTEEERELAAIKLKETKKRWAQNNKDRCRASSKRYYQSHKEQILDRKKVYVAAHPGYKTRTNMTYINKHRYAIIVRRLVALFSGATF